MSKQNKIIIAGGTGFLGTAISKTLKEAGYDICVLTRKQSGSKNGIQYVNWDAKSPGIWINELEDALAIINLVGKSVNCRYTKKNKREIIASRIDATNAIGDAISKAGKPPRVWINASSAAIFGDAGDEIKVEGSGLGSGFPAEVCKQWEETFNGHNTTATRKVLLRIGLVFQRDIGLLQPFVKLTKVGFGSRFGNGEQYISWIHEDDFTNIILNAIVREEFEGIIHAASPLPVKNKQFFKELRSVLNIPVGVPLPGWLLQIGGLFAGTEASLLLSGRRVVSQILKEKNFQFAYPELGLALQNLCEHELGEMIKVNHKQELVETSINYERATSSVNS